MSSLVLDTLINVVVMSGEAPLSIALTQIAVMRGGERKS